jgi:hypothetical protein
MVKCNACHKYQATFSAKFERDCKKRRSGMLLPLCRLHGLFPAVKRGGRKATKKARRGEPF